MNGDNIPQHLVERHRQDANEFYQTCGDVCISDEIELVKLESGHQEVVDPELPDNLVSEIRLRRLNYLYKKMVA